MTRQPRRRTAAASASRTTPLEPGVAQAITQIALEVGGRNGNRRDAHLKHHGLVTAVVHIRPDVPRQLRHGLFAQAATYPAEIRFSNAHHTAAADSGRDNHGMAIKLSGVPGKKQFGDEADAFDLLLVDHPTFFTADPSEFAAIMRAVTGTGVLAKLALIRHPHALLRAYRMQRVIASPLAVTYFSMTAYRLGPHQVVKYLARPVGPSTARIPARPGEHFLRDALVRELRDGERWFDLCVQMRNDPYTMPIDDPTVEWSESDTRPIPVACIHIPQQQVDTPARDARAEKISFNPWRVTAEHEPVGRFNEVRRTVYEAVAAQRA